MNKMSYKTFSFPCNPARIEVKAESMISTAHCPEFGPVHQHLGPRRRVITGNGVFYGETARSSYCALEALFWQQTPGALYIPGLGTVIAFFSELSLAEEGDGSLLRYTFRFEEAISATDGEGTRYVD